jgi:hypothetical protein
MEDHTIRFDICEDYHTDDDKQALYIVIKEHGKHSLRERIRRAKYFVKNWKKYVDGEDIISQGVLMKTKQIEELYDVLLSSLKEADILNDKDVAFIENGEYNFLNKKVPVVYKNKKFKTQTVENINVLFMGDEFVISVDTFTDKETGKEYFRDMTFGYRLHENYTKKDAFEMAFYHLLYGSNNFVGGDFEGFMTKDNVVDMLKIFYYYKVSVQ